jgi:hypothetical protein
VVSVNYSRRPIEAENFQGSEDYSNGGIPDGNGQLDLHVSYQIVPQVTVFGDAINLTNAPWRRYIGVKNQLVEREQYGLQLRGAVQVHF